MERPSKHSVDLVKGLGIFDDKSLRYTEEIVHAKLSRLDDGDNRVILQEVEDNSIYMLQYLLHRMREEQNNDNPKKEVMITSAAYYLRSFFDRMERFLRFSRATALLNYVVDHYSDIYHSLGEFDMNDEARVSVLTSFGGFIVRGSHLLSEEQQSTMDGHWWKMIDCSTDFGYEYQIGFNGLCRETFDVFCVYPPVTEPAINAFAKVYFKCQNEKQKQAELSRMTLIVPDKSMLFSYINQNKPVVD